MMNWEIELTRNNVTPAKFFAEIRFACKKKGIDFGLDLEQFANPVQQYNSRYTVIDGKKICYFDNYRYEESAASVGKSVNRFILDLVAKETGNDEI